MRQRTLWSFGRAYKGGKMLLPSGWRRPDSLEASTYHYTHTLAAHPITHSVRQINTSETHTGKKKPVLLIRGFRIPFIYLSAQCFVL